MAGVEPNSGKNPGNTIQCLSNSEGQAPNCSYCHKGRHVLAQCAEFLKVSPSDQPTSVRTITHKMLDPTVCGIQCRLDGTLHCVKYQCIERDIWIVKSSFIKRYGFNPDTGVVDDEEKVPWDWRDKVLFPDLGGKTLVSDKLVTQRDYCSDRLTAVSSHKSSPKGATRMIPKALYSPISKVHREDAEEALKKIKEWEVWSKMQLSKFSETITSEIVWQMWEETEMADQAYEATELLCINNFYYAKARLYSTLRGMSEEYFDFIDRIFDSYLVEGRVIVEVTDDIKDPLKEHAIWWAHFPVVNHNSDATSMYLLRYKRCEGTFDGDVAKMLLKENISPEDRKYARFIWVSKNRLGYRYFQFKTHEGDHPIGYLPKPDMAEVAERAKQVLKRKELEGKAAERFKPDRSKVKEPLSLGIFTTSRDLPTSCEKSKPSQGTTYKGISVPSPKSPATDRANGRSEISSKSVETFPFESFGRKDSIFGYLNYRPRLLAKLSVRHSLRQYLSMDMDFLSPDDFTFKEESVWTKARCLSLILRMYDPLGYATPVFLEASLFVRDMWRSGSIGTDPLSEDELSRWSGWLANVPQLEELHFERIVLPNFLAENFQELLTEGLKVQFHVFVDMSDLAVVSSVYIRISHQCSVYTKFFLAKHQVLPVNVVKSTSEFGLMSIHHGAQIASLICEALNFSLENVTLWSSSKAALQCLDTDKAPGMPYIESYLKLIRKFINLDQVRWVPGEENPARTGTQPRRVDELLGFPLWTSGPNFLKNPSVFWPVLPMLADAEEAMDWTLNDDPPVLENIHIRGEPSKVTREGNLVLEDLRAINGFAPYVYKVDYDPEFGQELTNASNRLSHNAGDCVLGADYTSEPFTVPLDPDDKGEDEKSFTGLAISTVDVTEPWGAPSIPKGLVKPSEPFSVKIDITGPWVILPGQSKELLVFFRISKECNVYWEVLWKKERVLTFLFILTRFVRLYGQPIAITCDVGLVDELIYGVRSELKSFSGHAESSRTEDLVSALNDVKSLFGKNGVNERDSKNPEGDGSDHTEGCEYHRKFDRE